ncbi:uncharacterized protein DDB_G0283357-like [Culicoides brevitarsis]|uniref:uncharacterized protein DDB_G0283357-like n=1 Tax=Culicoides brevitarsis TaxID=469753 RepID=UPI00307CB03D
MDCYNNYIDYRNGPNPYMHPYHHSSLHPSALRYGASHPSHHHPFAARGYGGTNSSNYGNYYDTYHHRSYYHHQYSSNGYNHPASMPPSPSPHYQNSYASLRDGFGNSNGNLIGGNENYPGGYYGGQSTYGAPSSAANPYENFRQASYHHAMPPYHRSGNYFNNSESNFYASESFESSSPHHQQTNPSTPSSAGTPKSAYADEFPASPAVAKTEKEVESSKNASPDAAGTGSSATEMATSDATTPNVHPPQSPMTPNSTDLSNSTSESFCNNNKNRRRSQQRNERATLMSRKNNNGAMINDPYEFTDEYNNAASSPNESRVPNNECSSQAWMHQGVQNTHKWMRGHHHSNNKKGLPMSDLELLQSSFEYGFYNNNNYASHDAYRRKMSEKHFISDGPNNDVVPAKRTKRRRRDNNPEVFSRKVAEEKLERKPPEPPLTPLPGFQEAFGSTEIGRFSDAFFNVLNSSPYYEPNNESDIDTLSPQPWEAGDSLEGPHFNLQVGASFTPVYDNYSADGSPLDNYFSELSCNEF